MRSRLREIHLSFCQRARVFFLLYAVKGISRDYKLIILSSYSLCKNEQRLSREIFNAFLLSVERKFTATPAKFIMKILRTKIISILHVQSRKKGEKMFTVEKISILQIYYHFFTINIHVNHG